MIHSGRFLHLLFLYLISVCAHAAEQDRTFRVINASNDLADNSAQVLACNELGRIIIATVGNVNFYEGESFRHIDTRQDLQYPLPAYQGDYRFYFDNNYHIWLKNTKMVTCVNLLTELFVENVDSLLHTMGAIEPVSDLFVDSTGCVWTLTSRGLQEMNTQKYYAIPREHELQDLDVMDGQLLLFYGNGSEVGIDIETGRVLHTTQAYDEASVAKYDGSSFLLRHGDGFFQVRNGEKESILLYFDARFRTWTTIVKVPYHMNRLCVHRNKLYIPSEVGYAVYDIDTQEMEYVNTLTLSNGRRLQTDCNDIVFDRQGGMWIGTENRGVLYSSRMESPFKIYPWGSPQATEYAAMMDAIEEVEVPELEGLQTNCCYIDGRGWKWIGTTAGLYLYKTPDSEPIIFSKRNGFYNDVVHSVTEGILHNIWVATSGGISCIMFDGEEFDFVNTFTEEDNVPYESFVNGKAFCVDSLIMMQSLDHVIVFNPQHLDYANKRRPLKLFPRLIRLMVNGNEVEANEVIDKIKIVDKAVTRCRDINLASTHTNVSLLFTALNYYRPRQTYYRVHLVGAGKDDLQEFSYFDAQSMVDRKGLLHYPLYGLEPGDYELTIQASMFPGMYDDDQTITWHIHVNRPWWRSMRLYLLFGLAITILTFYNLFYFSRNTRMRLRRNSEEGDLLTKITSFAERNDKFESEQLMPTQEEFQSGQQTKNVQLSQEFMEVMTKLLPYIREHRNGFSMHALSEVAGIDLPHLYDLILPHIHKSPRDMVLYNRLRKVADLLKNTDKSVSEIADECGFYTPNYMIGTFYHQYKQTPEEYRRNR